MIVNSCHLLKLPTLFIVDPFPRCITKKDLVFLISFVSDLNFTKSDLVFTDQNFKQEVLGNSGLAVVDFWAPWCGPCKIVGPIIDELAKEYEGKVKIGKINVDENSQTAGQYGVMSIPSVLFFKNGQPIKTLVGAQSKENYKQEIEQILSS